MNQKFIYPTWTPPTPKDTKLEEWNDRWIEEDRMNNGELDKDIEVFKSNWNELRSHDIDGMSGTESIYQELGIVNESLYMIALMLGKIAKSQDDPTSSDTSK